ncbi:DUF6862 domain-containing protein, partial [Burkholderia gladioli]
GAVSAGLNPIIDANGNIPPAVLTAIETLVSGSVAGSLGFNVQGAVTAAQNETLNNWLNHVTVLPGQQSQAQQLQSAMAACDSGNSSACTTVATLMQTSSANDQTLATACESPGSLACAYQESRAYLADNNISVANGVTVATDAQQPAYTAPSQAAATLDNMLGSPLAGIFGGLMYAAGASPTDAYYASVIGQATEGIAAGAAGFTMPSAPTNGSSASTSRATNNAPLGLGSTGRAVPNNLQEQLALQQAMSNPAAGVQLPIPLGDSRWPAADGWVKMPQNVNGVEIHYVRNVNSGAVDDFKFK